MLTELIETPVFNGLVARFLPLNEEMKINYSQFRQDEGKVIVRAFRRARFDESSRDSSLIEAPRFNEGASLV